MRLSKLTGKTRCMTAIREEWPCEDANKSTICAAAAPV